MREVRSRIFGPSSLFIKVYLCLGNEVNDHMKHFPCVLVVVRKNFRKNLKEKVGDSCV